MRTILCERGKFERTQSAKHGVVVHTNPLVTIFPLRHPSSFTVRNLQQNIAIEILLFSIWFYCVFVCVGRFICVCVKMNVVRGVLMGDDVAGFSYRCLTQNASSSSNATFSRNVTPAMEEG